MEQFWYAWPGDETALYGRPCDGFYWELLPGRTDIYVPVRVLESGEDPQILPCGETSFPFQTLAPQSSQPHLYERRTALYRCFNEAGELIYVGVAVDPERRRKQHQFHSRWWIEVVRTELEWRDSRTEALEAEAVAIATECPKYNIAGKGAN